MAFHNGRLPRIALAPITVAANGQQAYLRRDAAKAFMAMNAESEARFAVTLRATSARVAYRPIKDQNYFWDQYVFHGGALAARPGNSNHGLGLAVDFATEQMREVVDRIGAKYGWAKKWSDAPGEWWHILWRRTKYKAKWGYGTIRLGDTGYQVRALKKLMRKRGLRRFDLRGGYGPGARAAIKRYQKKHGLKVDGIVGPTTWHKLYTG